jgi:hypothetical protein
MTIDPRINHLMIERSSKELARLEAVLVKVAHLLDRDPVYTPLFERIEDEIRLEKKNLANGPQARARALLTKSGATVKTI